MWCQGYTLGRSGKGKVSFGKGNGSSGKGKESSEDQFSPDNRPGRSSACCDLSLASLLLLERAGRCLNKLKNLSNNYDVAIKSHTSYTLFNNKNIILCIFIYSKLSKAPAFSGSLNMSYSTIFLSEGTGDMHILLYIGNV